MITIDIHDTHDTQPMNFPRTWGEVAGYLGASTPAIAQCRRALDRFDDPITPELVEEIRRMVRYCQQRNAGGGGKCTRSEYIRLRAIDGGVALEARLKQFGII